MELEIFYVTSLVFSGVLIMYIPHENLLGAHISIAGGFDKVIERGASIGCNTIQVFTKSNRQWYTKEITTDEIKAFNNAQNNYGIHHVVAHASYLINIGSPKENIAKQSVHALIDELKRCILLGIPYLVIHPGSHTGSDEQSCLDRIAQNISYIFSEVPGDTMILLETMAGQGSTVCYTFEHLAHIINKTTPQARIGVCMDTCHVFAAGYDCTTLESYNSMWYSFDTIVGRNYLKALHLNDSKKTCGSRIDRHEKIGKGAIGLEGFRFFMNDQRLTAIPKIVETPITSPKSALMEFKENMEILRNLIKEQ